MLRLKSVALARGVRPLYKDVCLAAAPGERVGLVGANGSGKSTLFAAVLGTLGTEAGDIESPPSRRIAHVAQDIEDAHIGALDYVLEGHVDLCDALAELRRAEAGHDDLALAHAHASLAELNEGAIRAQALTVLHGLGFAPDVTTRSLGSYSGGWRNRLALARALLRPAELLLLDEPTNHLDLDSVIWLEAWLRRQPATVIVISHDREFLDQCVDAIWHVEAGTADTPGSMRRYAGNFSRFESALMERRRQQDADARSYQRTAAHLQGFVDRFRAQATKARQAQSRLKMLQRLVEVEPTRAAHEWRFEFPEPRALPEQMLQLEQVALGYGSHLVLQKVERRIVAGDRIGVLGVNGAGKSTLIKAIVGDLPARSGVVRRADGTTIGYFAQHQIDQFEDDDTPLLLLRRQAPQNSEQEFRNFLGGFRFSGDMATQRVGSMSGGERARCALALIAWLRPNLLVLDEPTNHLDMETREALTMALSGFPGALLLVSHDRHLLRATTDLFWLVHDGRVGDFEGDLEDYASLVLASRRTGSSDKGGGRDGVDRRQERQAQAAAREQQSRLRKPIEQRLKKTERAMTECQDKLARIDLQLADPGFYASADAQTLAELTRTRAEASTTLHTLEDSWLADQDELERINVGAADPAG